MMAFERMHRRAFPVLLLFVLIAIVSSRPLAAQTCPANGDVNQDSNLTPADALLTFQHFLAIANPPLDTCQRERADVNQDASITPADALCIFQDFLNPSSCINRPPEVATPIPPLTEVGNNASIVLDLTDTFDDSDGDPMTLQVVGNTRPDWVTASMAGTMLILAFQPDQHGVATLTIRADDGRGGQVETTLSVMIDPLPNRSPRVIHPIADVVVNEDTGNIQRDLSTTFDDPDGDPLTLSVVSNTNPALLSATLQGTTLSLNFQPDQHGVATLTIRADDGRGGQVETALSVAVRSVNDPPRFTSGSNQVVLPDAGPRTIVGWASGVSPGPGNETDQTVAFEVTTDNDALFVTPPYITPGGTLTYTTGLSAGLATVSVHLRDTGGTADGGVDTSQAQSFTITVQNVRLTAVGGNNQVATPGEVLNEPLVVRVEDEFGNPIEGVEVTGEVIQGDADFVDPTSAAIQSTTRFGTLLRATDSPTVGATDSPTAVATDSPTAVAVTNENGEARFSLQIRVTTTEDILTQVSALGQSVEFLTLVGFIRPGALAVEADGHLVVTDTDLDGVIRVEPTTGSRTLISGRGRGHGLSFLTPLDIAVEATGSLIVLDSNRCAVIRVDPSSGDRTVVSGCAEDYSCLCQFSDRIGGGPPLLGFPSAVAVETSGTLLVLESSDDWGRVMRVNPLTGNRSIVSGCMETDSERFTCLGARRGNGPSFNVPTGLAVDASGALMVATRGATVEDTALLRINPDTGDRIIVSQAPNIGNGPPYAEGAIVVEQTGSLVVVSNIRAAVMRVDPRSGDRTIVSGCVELFASECNNAIGSGPSLSRELYGIAVEATGDLVVADQSNRYIVRIDPATGDRSIISQAFTTGEGPLFHSPQSIAVEATGAFVVTDSFSSGAVIRVDPSTGDRAIVSKEFVVGSGPRISPRGIAVERMGTLVVMDDSGHKAVTRVDPVTGDRTIMSGCTESDIFSVECFGQVIGSGPLFPNFGPRIAVEATGALVVLASLYPAPEPSGLAHSRAVVRIDPLTGDRTIVSGCTHVDFQRGECIGDVIGNGPLLLWPLDIAVETTGAILVTDNTLEAIIRVDPVTGDRTIVSGCSAVRPPGIPTGDPPCIGAIVGSGPVRRLGSIVAVESTGTLVAAVGGSGIVRISPVTGDRTIVSGCTDNNCIGIGPFFEGIRDIIIEDTGAILVLDGILKAVLRVDPITGDRTIVSR